MQLSASLRYLLAVCLVSSPSVLAQNGDGDAVPDDLDLIGATTPEGGVVTGADVNTVTTTKVNETVVESFDPDGVDPTAPEATEACPTYAELNIEADWSCTAEALAHDSVTGVWAKIVTNYTHTFSNKDDYNFVSARHPSTAPEDSMQSVCAFSNFLSHLDRQRAQCASVEDSSLTDIEFGFGCEPKSFRYLERTPLAAAVGDKPQTPSYAASATCVRLVTKAVVTGQVVTNETVSEVVAEVVRPANATGPTNPNIPEGAGNGTENDSGNGNGIGNENGNGNGNGTDIMPEIGGEDTTGTAVSTSTDITGTADGMNITGDGMENMDESDGMNITADGSGMDGQNATDPLPVGGDRNENPFQNLGGSATVVDVDGSGVSQPQEINNTPSTPGLQFVDDESEDER